MSISSVAGHQTIHFQKVPKGISPNGKHILKAWQQMQAIKTSKSCNHIDFFYT